MTLSAAVALSTLLLAGAAEREPRDPEGGMDLNQATAEVVRLVEAKKCDEAFMALSAVRAPKPANTEGEKAGRTLGRMVGQCRKDPAIALAIAEKAAALAPADPGVQLTVAESLLALNQRGEAAALLDRIIKVHGDEAPQARIVRAKIAQEDGEHDVALHVLKPLEGDADYGEQASRMLKESEEALKKRHGEEADLALVAAENEDASKRLDDAVKQARELDRAKASGSRSEAAPASGRKGKKDADLGGSGRLVVSLRGKVGVGGQKTFKGKGIRKGQSYVFEAIGECHNKVKKQRKRGAKMLEDPNRDIFGIDFAVQVGSLTPRQLSVGINKADKSEVHFTAEENDPTITVMDRGHPDAVCTVSDFAVLTE